eukprot:7702932-Pyramimonas_sp.AAC.1
MDWTRIYQHSERRAGRQLGMRTATQRGDPARTAQRERLVLQAAPAHKIALFGQGALRARACSLVPPRHRRGPRP